MLSSPGFPNVITTDLHYGDGNRPGPFEATQVKGAALRSTAFRTLERRVMMVARSVPPVKWSTAWRLAMVLSIMLPGCSPSPTQPAPASSGPDDGQVALEPSADPAVYRGAGLAHLGCPQCHDVGIVGAGPAANASAPTFASVANREGMTALKIQQWLRSSHPTMPGYFMDDQTNSDLAAYIISLRRMP